MGRMNPVQGTVVERRVSDGPAMERGSPSTFAERGVAVPFTTPALGGARARPRNQGHGGRGATAPGARRGSRLELLVPNPSGKEGVYVVEWARIPEFCTPTLFDRDLMISVAALPAITPASIRGAVRLAAGGGLAGEAVSEAAVCAGAADQQEWLFAHVELLLALIRQGEARFGIEAHGAEAPTSAAGASEGARSALEGLERRARRVVVPLAAELGMAEGGGEVIGRSVEQLATLFSGIGLGRRATTARLARLQEAVANVAREAGESAGSGDAAARLVEMVADATARAAEPLLRAARSRAEDVAALLCSWLLDAPAVADELARVDWLLDGWERLAVPQNSPRRAEDWAILASQLPVIPDEAASWSAIALELAADARRMQRRVALGEDWRSGVTLADLVVANEQALARQISGAIPAAAGALAA